MGQQQLLLLVLGAIIVGVAIVVGVNMFSTSAVNANRDAVVQDCMTLATRAQQWYRTPAILGGGGRQWTGIHVDKLRFPSSNENGESYSIAVSGTNAQISATGREPAQNKGQVTVIVTPDSIRTPVFVAGTGWAY